MYLIVLLPNYKRTYDHIDLIRGKSELFIENWSYSYGLKRVFATYQRMRLNRKILGWNTFNQKYGNLPPKKDETNPWDTLCVELIGPYTIPWKGKSAQTVVPHNYPSCFRLVRDGTNPH